MDKKKHSVSSAMHYTTLAALMISNLCTLGLGMLFAASYGNAIGATAGIIEMRANAAPLKHIQVNGRGGGGGGGSNLPAAPTRLYANYVGPFINVRLSWIDNATNEQGFLIERLWNQSGATSTGTSTVTWQHVGTAGPWNHPTSSPVFFFSFLGLGQHPTSSPQYRVRAYNAFGNSPYSNTATATLTPTSTPGM